MVSVWSRRIGTGAVVLTLLVVGISVLYTSIAHAATAANTGVQIARSATWNGSDWPVAIVGFGVLLVVAGLLVARQHSHHH